MTTDMIYFNGSLKPRKEVKVDPTEPGFIYGAGLFETMRIENGEALFLPEHLDRLITGARQLGWQLPEKINLEEAVQATIAANGVDRGRARVNLILGTSGCHLMITVQAGLPYTPEDYVKGYRASIVSIRKNHHSPLSGLKTMNYLENLLALAEAQAKGAKEAILLNLDGYLAEGSRSNLFLVRQGILYTPDLASGPLPGLVRARVLKLALQAGLPVEEKPLSPGELLAAEEAFLTNSLMEIMPLTHVDDRPIGTGKPGPITTQLCSLY
jgi:branched-chain amino acid aminotransferase